MDVCTLRGCKSNCQSVCCFSQQDFLINVFLSSFPLVTSHWVSAISTLAVLKLLKLFYLSLVHVGNSPLAVMMVFEQNPFLKMSLYPLKITSLCWTLQLSVQTGGQCCSPGSAAAHGSAICPWGRDETPTDTACENVTGVIISHSLLER